MPRRARIHYVSIRSSLVNLPISIYGPLLERSVRPQNLAVHLRLVSKPNVKTEAYVGWTGMASASSLAHFNSSDPSESGFETIEIDPQYAQGLGLAQDDVVEIGLLHDLPLAKSVGTEPLSSDDWEIIEINASHVESTLLSQVRVAKIGQEIDVWVLGRTRVRLRVTSLDPPSKSDALLLTTNTEVSIAPKPRRPAQQSSSAPLAGKQLAGVVAANGAPTPSEKTPARASATVLRVFPLRACAALDPAFDPHAYTGRETLAFVSPGTYARLYAVPPVAPRVPVPRSALPSTHATYHRTAIRRLRPPSDPSAPSVASTSAPAAPVVLNPGKEKADEQDGDAGAEEAYVYVGWLDGIPESHIILPNLIGAVEDWDLVRVTPSESKSIQITDKLHAQSSSAAPPTTSTSHLAGIDAILTQCIKFCVTQFALHANVNVVHGVPALLVTGRQGAGKTSIVQAVAKSLQENPKTYTYTYYVDLAPLSEQPVAAVKALFKFWLDKAAWHRPSVLILDNLEKLLGAEVEHADSFRARHLTEIFVSLYSSTTRFAPSNSRGIVMLATAPSTAAVHALLSTMHIFHEVVNVKPPNKDARRDILAKIIKDRLALASDIQQDSERPLNYTALATQTEGYSATDLQDLAARAVHKAAIRSTADNGNVVLTPADFEAAQVDFVPLSLRDVKLQTSDVEWADIGGLYETKRILRETIEWPTKYGPIFAQSPLRLRSGLLLYGFPGCGKTLLASAVAKECGLNFISVKGPELLNKYIGASEKSVRDLFERASAAKPCVLFFDEFDSIAPKRGHDSTGVTDRVVNQMLTQMDGAEGLEGVYVLAATSRPDLIDSALLRPGRLDKSLLCNMPTVEERADILRAVGRKVNIAPSVDLNAIAAVTEGYSGADLQALVYNAHLEVVHASMAAVPAGELSSWREETPVEYTTLGGPAATSVASRAEEAALQRRLRQIQLSAKASRGVSAPKATPAPPKKHEITDEYMQRVLKTTRPSVSFEEQTRLNRIYRAFVSDRSGDLPAPPDAGGIGHRATLM